MSSKQRFKWIRAVPTAFQPGQPGFYSFTLPRMRQIPTQIFSIAPAPGPSPIVSAFVPASSWAIGKLLFIRSWYQLLISPGPAVPGYSINELVAITGATLTGLPIPAPFTAVPGTFTTYIERCMIRIDPDIWIFDRGDAMQFNFANFDDSQQHVIQVSAVAPPFDYSSQIQVDLLFQIPMTIPGVAITAMWSEAFLEQATNLGKLP